MRTDGLNRSLSLWLSWWGGSANDSWSKRVQDVKELSFERCIWSLSVTEVRLPGGGQTQDGNRKQAVGREKVKKAKYGSMKPSHLPFKDFRVEWIKDESQITLPVNTELHATVGRSCDAKHVLQAPPSELTVSPTHTRTHTRGAKAQEEQVQGLTVEQNVEQNLDRRRNKSCFCFWPAKE